MAAINYWDGTKWVSLMGPQGPKGDTGPAGADGVDGKDGVGFSPTGDWQADTVYGIGDVVQFGGSSFVLVDSAPAGFAPDDPNAGAFWNLLASAGKDGADGAKGDKGDTGSDGADGRSVEVYVQASQPAGAVKGDFWIEP